MVRVKTWFVVYIKSFAIRAKIFIHIYMKEGNNDNDTCKKKKSHYRNTSCKKCVYYFFFVKTGNSIACHPSINEPRDLIFKYYT